MLPRLTPAALKKTKAREYVARFLFGGIVTVVAGLVAKRYGPEIGGLLLAFPAILPASLTLVKQHGGTAKAVDDARGAQLGSLALATFGWLVWSTAQSWPPPLVLAVATLAWLTVAGVLWMIEYGTSVGR